jgi:ligand-binding sensor domain-containing protein
VSRGLIFLLITVIFLVVPVSGAVHLFAPGAGSVSSDRVYDMVDGPNGQVILATDNGISTFDGSTWTIYHANRVNRTQGLLDDLVVALAYDYKGGFWMGYPDGMQRFDGVTYRVFDDPEAFVSLSVHDIQRWDQEMWVAVGTSGLYRYAYGTWTWFQPFKNYGPGCYGVDSMAVDEKNGALILASTDGGLWEVPDHSDPVQFIQVSDPEQKYTGLNHVRYDPLGGVYAFNQSMIAHYSADGHYQTVLTPADLAYDIHEITDVAASPDGMLWIGTPGGLVGWQDGRAVVRYQKSEGIGDDSYVQRIFMDAEGRCWFTTNGYVGYVDPDRTLSNHLAFAPPTTVTTVPTPSPSPLPIVPVPGITASDRGTTVPSLTMVPTQSQGSFFELVERYLIYGIKDAFRSAEQISGNVQGREAIPDPQRANF